jgi:hypothetical protein
MSGVLIRCQHCGTTQATLGECEACHEGETRHFCPNHAPGLWLDGPACATCGARVGVPPVVRPEPPRAASPPRGRGAARAPAPPRDASGGAPPSPFGRRSARPRDRDRESERERERDHDSVEVWTGPIRTPRRGGIDEPGAFGSRGGWPVDPTIAPVVFKVVSAFGCLRRLVMIIVILIVLAILAFFGLFGVGGLLYGNGPSRPVAADVAFWSAGHAPVAVHTRMQRFTSTCRLTVALPAPRNFA